MRIYLIESPSHVDKFVFAHNHDEAAEIITGWQALNNLRPDTFSVDGRRQRFLSDEQTRDLPAAYAEKFAGIGRYRPHIGWLIEVPRVER
jgi:hypothetical protein